MRKYLFYLLKFIRSLSLRHVPRKRFLAALAVLAFVILPLVYLSLKNASPSLAAWWNDAWMYRNAIPISSHTAAENNVYIIVTVDTSASGQFQVDCGDLRFTKQNGELLPYYIVSGCTTASTVVHVLFDTFPAGAQTIYYYYGNPSAANGFSSTDFATQATNYVVGTVAAQEVGGGPVAYWKFDEGQGVTANNSVWKKTGTTTNLVTNPSFETNTTGWFLQESPASTTTWSRVTTSASTGAASLSVSRSVAGWGYPTFVVTVTPGQTYYVTAYAKIIGTGTGSAYFGGNSHDPAWAHYTSAAASTLSASTLSGWVRLSTTITPGAGETSFDLYAGMSNDGTTLFDSIQVEQASTANLYCDGSILGNGSHVWNGTANASTSTCDTGTDGSISGATWATEDKCMSGKCLSFSGPDRVIVDNNVNTDLSGNLTISFWIKSNDTTSQRRNPIDKAYYGEFSFTQETDRSISYYHGQSGASYFGTTLIPSGTIQDNTWYYITMVRDTSQSKVYGYVNGKQVSNSTYAIAPSQKTDNIYIGGGYTGYYYKGFVDEPKIYTYARTAAQVKSDFASKGGGSAHGSSAQLGASNKNLEAFSNGLVGYWKMDEAAGAGSTLADSSGNANNGTAVLWGGGNTATDSAHLAGKFGNSFSFDGVDDYINLGLWSTTTSLKAVRGNWSYGAWIKTSSDGNILNDTDTDDFVRLYVTGGKARFLITAKYSTPKETATATSTTSVNDNKWHHVVGVWSGDNIYIYVDGVMEGSDSGLNGFNNLDMSAWSGSWIIGAQWDSCCSASPPGNRISNKFTGLIDDIRIYNRALSGSEVSQLYSWAPGPVGYWNFDEKTGSYAYDTSGNGSTGTLTNSPSWSTGKIGGALSFSGNKYVDAGDTNSLKLTSTGTLEAWIYPRAYPTAGSWSVVASKGNWGAGRNEYSIYYQASSSNIRFEIAGSSATPFATTANTNTPLNRWSHLALTFDGTNIQGYVNGVPVGTSVSQQSQVADTTGYNFMIGGRSGLYALDGIIDQVSTYNYARTAGQVVEDMNAGHPAPGAPIGSAVGYWKFDEGYGTTLYDSSPTGNNGSMGSSPRTPTWSNSGKYNKALSFDATTPANGDVVNFTDNSAYQVTTGLTLSAWVNPGVSTGGTEWIVARGYGSAPWDDYNLTRTSTGAFRFQVRLASGLISASTTSSFITTNTWYHLVGTYDATTGNAYLYVNGVNKGSSTGTGNIQVSSTRLKIGCWGTAADNCDSTTPFNGLIDEVKIYNSALTASQVALDYNHGSAMVLGESVGDNSDDAVGYWKLDENTSTTANNSGSCGSNCNGTWSGTTTSIWTTGKINGGGNFANGANNQIALTSDSSLRPANAVSVEFFVYPRSLNIAQWYHFIGFNSWNTEFSMIKNNDANNTLYWTVYAGGSATSTTYANPFPNLNQWYHVAATYGDGYLRLYINGSPVGTPTAKTGTITYVATTPTIGKFASGYIDGIIDEFKIYNYTRSPSQIKADAATNAQNPILPGAPVGEWNFEEGSGGSVNDTSGNGYVGTWSGTGNHYVPGKFGKAGNLNGTDDFVTVTDNANLRPGTSDFTVGLWVKVPFTSNGEASGWGSFFTKGLTTGAPAHTWGFWRYGTTTNQVAFAQSSDAGGSFDVNMSTAALSNGWHYIAAKRSGTITQLFVDGSYYSQNTNAGDNLSDASDIKMGRNNSSYTQASIDQVRYYNYARTPAQIAYDYNRGGPVGWWKLDECQGTVANDSSGNGNAGTITIGATVPQTSAGTCTDGLSTSAWNNGKTGKYNSSLNFDGADDQVKILNSSSFNNIVNGFSVSSWFKSPSGSARRFIFGKYNGTGISSEIMTTGMLRIQARDGGSGTPDTDAYSTTRVDDNQWHNEVYIWNKPTLSLYVDGQFISSATNNTVTNLNSATDFYIGSLGSGWLTSLIFNGQIDDMRIYNYALTPQQVKQVYNNGAVNYGPATGTP